MRRGGEAVAARVDIHADLALVRTRRGWGRVKPTRRRRGRSARTLCRVFPVGDPRRRRRVLVVRATDKRFLSPPIQLKILARIVPTILDNREIAHLARVAGGELARARILRHVARIPCALLRLVEV